MILVIDNNTNSRGQNIASLLTAAGVTSTHYKFVTGITEKTGDWDDLKSYFEALIRENTVLVIHKNNSRSEDAAKCFLEKDNTNRVVLFSGGGNFSTLISNLNCLAFQGKVSDDAKTEWDLAAFALALANGGNIFDALQSFDPKLEELLKPFAASNPFLESDELKEAKKALNDHIKSKA